MSSTRERIRAAARAAVREIAVEGFDEKIRVRELNPAHFDKLMEVAKAGGDTASHLIVACVVDEEGKPIWDTVDEIRDEIQFKKREVLGMAVMQLNGLTSDKVEEAAKN